MNTRYLLHTLVDGSVQSTPNYESHKLKIDRRGCSKINDVVVYMPELAIIFELNEIPARDMNRDVVIDTRPYFDVYVTAFHEGEQYFDANYDPSPNIIYGSGGRQFMVDLHAKYFHAGHDGCEGWNFVKKQYPVILIFEVIRQFGHFSGIIHRADAMIKKYSVVFRDFHNHGVFCNQSTATEFETIFPKSHQHGMVKQLLLRDGYADDNGMWIGKPSELTLVVDALFECNILRKNICDRTTAIRVFCDEFGLKIGPGGTSLSTLRKKRSTGIDKFTELFSRLS